MIDTRAIAIDLIARCAALGFALRPDGDGWELRGNGRSNAV